MKLLQFNLLNHYNSLQPSEVSPSMVQDRINRLLKVEYSAVPTQLPKDSQFNISVIDLSEEPPPPVVETFAIDEGFTVDGIAVSLYLNPRFLALVDLLNG